jgi:hypothetical protein
MTRNSQCKHHRLTKFRTVLDFGDQFGLSCP